MRPALVLALVISCASFADQRPLKISLEVQRADIHNLLRFFGTVAKVNFVIGDDVQGTVTMRLLNVSVDDAIDAVLAARGLGAEKKGNIIRVAPLAQLASEAKARAELVAAREQAAPLETTLMRVNYARAEDLASMVKAQLSPRGTVAVDARTNTLIIRDVAR